MPGKRACPLALSTALLLTAQFIFPAMSFGSTPTIGSFNASPTTITMGRSTTLSWTTSHATSLSITGIGSVTGTSLSISPTTTTTYTLTASNASGYVTRTVTITVNANTGGTITRPSQATNAGFTTLSFDDEFTTLNLAPGANDPGYVWHKGIWYQSTLPDASLITNPAGVLDLAWNRKMATRVHHPALPQITTISHDGKATAKTFRYGYFEARMKWDVAVGMWPAFWLNPIHEVLGGGGLHGEIDIFEGQGSDPNLYYGTLHNWSGSSQTAPQRPNPNYANLPGVDFSQWHKYGLLWTPGQIRWYFDDRLIETAPTFSNMDNEDYYLLLSLNFGNNWNEGNLSGVTINSGHLQFDWVRVWQQTLSH
jgi:Glycosyl hydrolases family 16